MALPQRSPSPLSVPWIWRAPARTAANEFATACSVSLWAWMPTWSPGMTARPRRRSLSTSCGSVPPLVSHSTTQRAPSSIGRLRAGERIVRIGLVAVEEMLAVEQHLAALGLAAAHAVADRGEVLLERLQRDAHVIVPGLGDEADGVGLGGEQRGEARIVRGRAAGPPGHAEGAEAGAPGRASAEQFGVDRVGARIAALDIVDAEPVEHRGDVTLVGEREIDAGGQRAVAQRRVEQIEAFFGHGDLDPMEATQFPHAEERGGASPCSKHDPGGGVCASGACFETQRLRRGSSGRGVRLGRQCAGSGAWAPPRGSWSWWCWRAIGRRCGRDCAAAR